MSVRYLEDTEIYQEHFARDVPHPYLAMIESSSRCNLLCVMCPRTIGKSPSSGTVYGDLTMDLLDKIESLLPHLDQVALSWIGEPFLNRQIGEIIDRIKRWPIHVHITTNGMLLNDHYAQLVVTKKVDSIAVSIDGASDEVFEKIREGGSLTRIKENIKHVHEVKAQHGSFTPFLQVAFVAQPGNVHELPDMIDLVKELGIRQFTIGPLDDFLLPGDLRVSDEGALGPKDFARQKFYEMMRKAQEHDIAIGIESPHRLYHEIGDIQAYGEDIPPALFRNDYTREEIEANGWRKGCHVPWLHIMIGANGEVHPCCISPTSLGNLNENTIEEIWFGPKYRAFRKALKSTRPHRDCLNCRRAIWTRATPIDSLSEVMEVGGREAHGLGWGNTLAMKPGFKARYLQREGTAFLKNSGKPLLSLTLKSNSARLIRGYVRVNDVQVGSFRVGPAWRTLFYRLPALEGEVIKVTITTEPRSVHLLVHAIRQQEAMRYWRIVQPAQNWLSLPADMVSVGMHIGRVGLAALRSYVSLYGVKRGLQAVMRLLPAFTQIWHR